MDKANVTGSVFTEQLYVKKAIPIRATRQTAPFTVQTLEGELTGKTGDYLVTGVRGEQYPCDADIFHETYTRFDPIRRSFGAALEALKAGERVARAGWNGKGMWLVLIEGTTARGLPVLPDALASIEVGAYIVMFTAQGVWQPGWLASQADMLADDWTVLPAFPPSEG